MMRTFARIAGTAKTYKDGVECMEIHVALSRALGLPIEINRRVNVALCLPSGTFTAGLRARKSNGLAWICPDICKADGTKARLADALRESRLSKNQRVEIRADGLSISVVPA